MGDQFEDNFEKIEEFYNCKGTPRGE